VLHRIDADIQGRSNGKSSAVDVLFRRLKEESKISILFLDPRTDILDRLAKEEGQTPRSMLGDIEKSIAICHQLYEQLKEEKNLRAGASLTIRVYDQIPYFAYHRQKDETIDEIIIGFYFRSAIGHSSGAYELIDDETKHAFGGHFDGIMSEATAGSLLEFDGARSGPYWNEKLFDLLQQCIRTRLRDDSDTSPDAFQASIIREFTTTDGDQPTAMHPNVPR
jgi:hypothetical protein